MRRAKRLGVLFFVFGFCSCLFLIGTVRFLGNLNWKFFSRLPEKIVFYPLGKCPDCKKVSGKCWKIGSLNDNNLVHLEYARRLGIEPFPTNTDMERQLEQLLSDEKLEQLADGETYKLKELTHSYPYLVPEAVKLLNAIGTRFEEKLKEVGIEPYFMLVSSVLRTCESQDGLGRRNRNATDVSAHLYGTTFDISYKEFIPLHGCQAREGFCRHDMLRHPLAEVLTEMSEEGWCKVVREKRQACFHITVAK